MNLRSVLLMGVGLGLYGLGMRLCNQEWFAYLDTELLMSLGLAILAFGSLLGRDGFMLLGKALGQRRDFSPHQVPDALFLLRQVWHMGLTCTLMLIVIKGINALIMAGTPQEMAALGSALATLLLGGLYLLLLRGVFLGPAEAALHRQHLGERR